MQIYPFQFDATNNAKPVSALADLFVYESGSSAGDTRIKVKPDNGAEIILKPGQRFRISEGRAQIWYVSSYDGVSVINGNLIVGSGDFGDAATFANQATIVNNASQPIFQTQVPPVSLVNIAPVVVGVAQVLASAAGSYRRLIFRNAGAMGNIAIGAAGITLANGAIYLAPGEVYIEDQAAALAWYAIADMAGCSLAIQGMN
ncbi:hypothetical protein [Undibacterium sp. Ren11W]|uniref:hypothetical protein n=1 Tax=Undibacterium sp. Ren11W TaxID=3413045 RepID=UPI003BF25BBD